MRLSRLTQRSDREVLFSGLFSFNKQGSELGLVETTLGLCIRSTLILVYILLEIVSKTCYLAR